MFYQFNYIISNVWVRLYLHYPVPLKPAQGVKIKNMYFTFVHNPVGHPQSDFSVIPWNTTYISTIAQFTTLNGRCYIIL